MKTIKNSESNLSKDIKVNNKGINAIVNKYKDRILSNKDNESDLLKSLLNITENGYLLGVKDANEHLEKKIKKFAEALSKANGLLKYKKEIVELLKASIFGQSSEKEEMIFTKEVNTEVKETQKRGRKEGTHNGDNISSLIERNERTVKVNEEKCDNCGHELVSLGYRKLLKFHLDIKAWIEEIILERKKCSFCGKIYEAEAVDIFGDSFLTPSLASFIVTNKYLYGVPAYRMEDFFAKLGVPISRQLLVKYCINISEELKPIYNRMKEHLINENEVLQADEATVKVINLHNDKKRSTSYIWLYASTMYRKCRTVVFEYCLSREGSHAKEFLKGFHGILMTDAYSGYNQVEEVRHAYCWVHARREYAELLKIIKNKYTEEELSNLLVTKFITMIDKMMHIDNELCNNEYLAGNNLLEERKKLITPLVDEYFEECKEHISETEGKTKKAIQYSLNHEEGLRTFLDNAFVPMENNLAERGIKRYVIARKNFLFCYSELGAESSAILMSIILTAINSGINPQQYITYVLENITKVKNNDRDTLMPWNIPNKDKFTLSSTNMGKI